jgi:hypothetical protein
MANEKGWIAQAKRSRDLNRLLNKSESTATAY